MVKHTQTIRRQKPTNCLSVFDHFVWLVFKRSKNLIAYRTHEATRKDPEKTQTRKIS